MDNKSHDADNSDVKQVTKSNSVLFSFICLFCFVFISIYTHLHLLCPSCDGPRARHQLNLYIFIFQSGAKAL